MNKLLDKEWYTLVETAKILGLTRQSVFGRLQRSGNKKITKNTITESEFKKEGKFYYIHRNYLYRCMDINQDNKEWYTLSETAEILNIHSATLRKRIKHIVIEESHFKKEFCYFIHRDYINQCINKNNEDKKWHTIPEASKLLYRSEDWIRKRFKNGEIPVSAYKKENNLLIDISYINKENEYQALLEENYYTYQQASKSLSISVKSVKGLIKRKVFKDVITHDSKVYIAKNEVEKQKEVLIFGYERISTSNEINSDTNFKPETIKIGVIQKELNLSNQGVYKFIKEEAKILAQNFNGKQYHIEKESYDNFKKELVYTIKMASDFLKTSYEIAEMLITKKHIKAFNLNDIGWRTSETYLKEYLNNRNIPLEQLVKEMGTDGNTIYHYISKGELKTNKNPNDNRVYVCRDEADRFKNSLTAINMKYYNNDNHLELFNSIILFFRQNTKFKETLDLYEIWARKKLNKSKSQNLKNKIATITNTFNSLSSNLTKEIFDYTDYELNKLFSLLSKSYLKSLYPFINYCRKKRECNYIGDYGLKEEKKNNIEPYSKKEWTDLTLHVLDIDRHFEKAFKSKSYAEVWLWTLLHFSLDWRMPDLKKFKAININVIGIDNFNWFDSNTFTLEISQTILKMVSQSIKGIKASKNNKELIFVVPFIFEMPTAIAFTLCELHRRQSDENSNKLITLNKQTYTLKEFFGEGMPKFSNRRCNKTLMTYGWETAVKKGRGALAYSLQGFARSHTHNIDIPNEVTRMYIVTSNTDASVEEMALHAFERGIFGWQVQIMIDVLNNNKPLSLDEMTKKIVDVNNMYSPIMLDSLSNYAVTRHEQTVALFKELMSIPKQELKGKLKEISKLQSPALLNYTQCLIGIQHCPYIREIEYNMETPCLGCKNRIDTNYILDIINVEIFSLIEKLEGTPLSDEISRIKYTHMIRNLTYILLDFRRAYDKYDENYIRSFIDLDKLKSKFKTLEQTKFLKIEERKEF